MAMSVDSPGGCGLLFLTARVVVDSAKTGHLLGAYL